MVVTDLFLHLSVPVDFFAFCCCMLHCWLVFASTLVSRRSPRSDVNKIAELRSPDCRTHAALAGFEFQIKDKDKHAFFLFELVYDCQ